mgnify:FL=1
MITSVLVGLVGGAFLAAVYVGAFHVIIENIRGHALPWLVMAAAAGLALLVAGWGVARVAMLR